MTLHKRTSPVTDKSDLSMSLFQLLEQEVLANPYPLYHRLQNEDPVHWDPFLHTWVVTRYEDVMTVLQHFTASRSDCSASSRPALPMYPWILVTQPSA